MTKRFGRYGRLSAIAVAASVFAITVCVPSADVPASSVATADVPAKPGLTSKQRLEIEGVLTDLVQGIVAAQERLEGQGVIASPTVRFSGDGKSLIVEL